MLDTNARAIAPAFPIISNPEFLRAELSVAFDGRMFVTLTATVVDEQETQLLDQEIVRDQVATIDAALALIGEHARAAFASTRKEQ